MPFHTLRSPAEQGAADLIASRIPPGLGKELLGKTMVGSTGWWVDGAIGWSWAPRGGNRGEKEAKKSPKGGKREPKGGQNEEKMGPEIDLGGQWGPRAKKGDPSAPQGGLSGVFSRVPQAHGKLKHSKSAIR